MNTELVTAVSTVAYLLVLGFVGLIVAALAMTFS